MNSLLDTLTAVGGELPLLLGGDFNITTGVRHETEALKNTIGERQIQARLRTQFRLFNAWQILHPNTSLPQTLRWSKDRTQNYHCDAVFVSDQHLRHLLSAEVKAFGPWETLSDHLPMVVHMA